MSDKDEVLKRIPAPSQPELPPLKFRPASEYHAMGLSFTVEGFEGSVRIEREAQLLERIREIQQLREQLKASRHAGEVLMHTSNANFDRFKAAEHQLAQIRESKPSSPAPELPLDDATRKSFVLESIKLRQQTDPKFGSLDHFSECNFGSLSTYSGVVADYAQRTIAELQQKIDRMITANEWLMQDRAKVITELQQQLAQIKSAKGERPEPHSHSVGSDICCAKEEVDLLLDQQDAQIAALRLQVQTVLDNQAEYVRELSAARLEIAEKDSWLERLIDLVRYQRSELFEAKLIDEQEYAALIEASEGGQRVARLEGYDKIRDENAALKLDNAQKDARIAELEGGKS